MTDSVTQSEQLLQAIQDRAGKKLVNWCDLHKRKLTRVRTPQGKRYICRKCDTETKNIWKIIDGKRQEIVAARAEKERQDLENQ